MSKNNQILAVVVDGDEIILAKLVDGIDGLDQFERETKSATDSNMNVVAVPVAIAMHGKLLLDVARDAAESLKRLENKDGAFRVTSLQQINQLIEQIEGNL